MLADELAERLRILRVSVQASEAVIVYAPRGGALRVIAAEPLADAVFTPEEPVQSSLRWTPTASTVRHVRLTSLMRPVTLEFDRALMLPFADHHGRGAVILGAARATSADALATMRHFAREIDT